MPAVSVVVTTRNYGRYLAGALRSVLAQTFADLEIIVIDDGSADDTPEVVRPFLSDDRVHYHRTDGLGQSRAKNLGILQARAPLIAFLDGDDEWLPHKLEAQLPLFANPEVGVIYSRRMLMDGDGRDLPTPPAALAGGKIYDVLLVQNPVCFSSAMVRKSVFEAIGMFDPKLPLAIDYDLWLRVARHFEFDFVDEPLLRYRTGHANLSKRITERIAAVLAILRRSLVRRRNAETADPLAQAEAWGSTCRTMGYVLREERPLDSAGWYVAAARHDGRLGSTVKSILGNVLRHLSMARSEIDRRS
ncbi:MAG TPA: glycosyltransferase [Gemmataceae bacterium]|jgi:glycosyltransferase involved in cell wall biosynthesis|nr:glycosyltransferase [Gemmataceae bacterium]